MTRSAPGAPVTGVRYLPVRRKRPRASSASVESSEVVCRNTRTGVQQIATTDDKEKANSEPIIDQCEPGCRQVQDRREVSSGV